ncbi:MAG: 1-acyl-sn-glycerol-3-phosphate acyltransferase [Bacteroidaceae bacterium]|nr:1-acyl-sn-glycerol-3-phosphate acyltransferase [Bacteroidaceae bacterium]
MIAYFLVLSILMSIWSVVAMSISGNKARSKESLHKCMQRITRFTINHIPGTSYEYRNITHEKFDKPSMIVSNHQSSIDLLAMMSLTDKMVILTNKRAWENPVTHLLIKNLDFLPTYALEDNMEKLAQLVKEGYSIMVFPEGTRTLDGKIHRFHRGAFYMAEQFGLDIVPVVIDGLFEIYSKKAWLLSPGKFSVEVLPRIIRKENAGIDYRITCKNVHKLFIDKHEEMCNNR